MRTCYIKFYQVHKDQVWGDEPTSVCTSLVRVTRNRLRKAVFEWVGSSQPFTAETLAYYRKHYPIVRQVDL